MNEETVKVTLNLPKGLLDFLNDYKAATGFDTIQEYMEYKLIDGIRADIDAGAYNPTVKDVGKKYNITKAFEAVS